MSADRADETLAAVERHLYGLSPGAFVAERDRRAAAARTRGDRALATDIRALRRPTTGAWLANTLVRRRRAEIDELLALGADMRDAQEHLAAEDLRRLTRRRHRMLSELVRAARDLAAATGVTVGESAAKELSGTLEAALADADSAEALRKASLTTGLSHVGFAPAGIATATPDPTVPEARSPHATVVDAPADPATLRVAPAPAAPVPATSAGCDREEDEEAGEDAPLVLASRVAAELVLAQEASTAAEAELRMAREAATVADGCADELERRAAEAEHAHRQVLAAVADLRQELASRLDEAAGLAAEALRLQAASRTARAASQAAADRVTAAEEAAEATSKRAPSSNAEG